MMGSMSNVRIVEVMRPPITTIARGLLRFTAMPVDMAAGNKPIAAMIAVITTGRTLEITIRKNGVVEVHFMFEVFPEKRW